MDSGVTDEMNWCGEAQSFEGTRGFAVGTASWLSYTLSQLWNNSSDQDRQLVAQLNFHNSLVED